MKILNKSAQTWSLDVMVAVSVFILGAIVFFLVIENKSDSEKLNLLVDEAERISTMVLSSDITPDNPCSFIINNKLNKEKLSECAENYETTKQLLGVKKDFCIHFEDSKGNIINISLITGQSGLGFGDPEAKYKLFNESGDFIGLMPCTGEFEPSG